MGYARYAPRATRVSIRLSTQAISITLNLTASAVAGATIWALSPTLMGHVEPWDAEGVYYPVTLFVSGLVLGVIGPRAIWAHAVGIVIGQFLYMLIFLPIGPLMVLGVLFLFVYSLLTLAGAGFGSVLRKS